ncbi:MAG TPA: formaldehyde-activating enzyme [Gaiellaceae bacterium]|nr:formaldehyde-activating enzyme [Gaiellaceae bacterium]
MNVDPDGRFGEAWSGEAPNGSHINVVLGRRGSPTAAAAALALASPSPGHVPFLAAVESGTIVRPVTVVVNKSTLAGERLSRMTWGAAHVGIAQGVLDAVADGTLDARAAADLVLLVAVWVDPEADDAGRVRAANRAAMRDAIASALAPLAPDAIRDLAGRREGVANAYFDVQDGGSPAAG